MPYRDPPSRMRRLRFVINAASRLATLLGLALLAFLWIGTYFYLRLDREKSIEAAVDTTGNMALLFEQHVSRSIKEIDQTIQFIRHLYEIDPNGFDLQAWTSNNNLLHDLTVQIALIGADGRLISTNVSRNPTAVDLSDREHFRVHVGAASDALFISKPVLGRATGKWTIQLTRRMLKPDGTFGGVIVASLDPYYLSQIFQQIDVGPRGSITLVGTDGIIRARGGLRADELGRSIKEAPVLQALSRGRTGTRIGPNMQGEARITSYRGMKDFPLVVIVSEAESDVLAGFHERQRLFLLTAGGLSIIVLVVIGIGASREMRLMQLRAAQYAIELREREKSLELEATLHHMNQGIVMVDADRRLHVINPLAERFLGLETTPAPGELLPKASEALLLAAHDVEVEGDPLEITLADGDGTVIEIVPRDLPDGGRLYGMTDITQHKRSEAVLADARDRAEAGVRARTSFLATMSHEIRTPLNGVIGMTHLLESCSEEERAGYFLTMRRSAEHLQQIIEDILDVSKLEADRMTFDFLPYNVAEIVHTAVDMVAQVAAEKGLELSVAIDPAVPSDLMGDPGRLRQVILNLVGNAVKFTTSGSVKVSIDAVPGDPAGQMRMRVSDTGMGIAPADHDRLFNDFSQLDGSITRQFGGTGLGLAISRKLIENMGGAISLESALGVGSTFTILLPMTEAIPREARAPVARIAHEHPSSDGYNLLLAEDSATNTLVATKLLQKLGHQVTAVIDGAEAIDALANGSFDAVFMDVMMPRMDGLTATRLIRRSGQPYAAIPIIALTAAAMSEDRAEAFRAGVTAFTTKPVSGDGLRAALEEVFGAHALAS